MSPRQQEQRPRGDIPVCVPRTSSLIDCVTESSAAMIELLRFFLTLFALTVQVEEPTWGRGRGAPTSADRAAAAGARSRPTHESRKLARQRGFVATTSRL